MRSGGSTGRGKTGSAKTGKDKSGSGAKGGGRTGARAQRGGGADLPTPRVLREYALVADGERGAVIGPDGSIAWLCVPRWDSPAAFSGLLGGPGQYTITPADPWHVGGGYYENGSLIWRNRWVGDTRIECREALVMPADTRRAVLLRRVEAIDGTAKVTMTLDLRAGYGRGVMTDLKRHGDSWTGRSGGTWFRWSGAGKARLAGGRLGMRMELAPGTSHDLALELSDREFTAEPPDPGQSWAATEEAWAAVSPRCDDLIAKAHAGGGDTIGDEVSLKLRGFPGGTAKSGNWVRGQFQLDALGETLSLFAAAARLDLLAEDDWRSAAIAADGIGKRWNEPEAGIWELDDRRWTHSRLACVSGLRAIAAAAAVGAPGGHGHREAAQWSGLADAVATSLGDAVHPSGRWQRAPDDERVDAALLMPMIRGGYAADDPRNLATVEAVRQELAADGYVYRFRHDGRSLDQAEGAFLLCGFWMALAEHPCGNPVAAAHWFERNRSACGPAALYTEEYDVHQRQLRGNMPQAFVHAGLLECAVTLSRDVPLGRA